MLPRTDELVAKTDLMESSALVRTEMADLRTELRLGMTEVRAEVGALRREMEHKYATKDDLLAAINGFNDTIAGHVRTFVLVQAATVVGMSGMVFGLLRLT